MKNRTIKHFALVGFLGLIHLISTANAADNVNLNFSGKIMSTACSLANTQIDVPLGTWNATDFQGVGDMTDLTPFYFELDCPFDGPTQASITISGAPDSNDPTLLKIDEGIDYATGVAIAIFDRSGARITLGVPSEAYDLSSSFINRIEFNARYYATVERDNITGGLASATAQFTVNYP